MTLLVTAFIEIPVFLMIVGRSENLCLILGKSRYQLLMAFLPISMVRSTIFKKRSVINNKLTKCLFPAKALSGNCGKFGKYHQCFFQLFFHTVVS